MKENYFKSFDMIEKLYRIFLEVIKANLDQMKIRDINSIQCIVLYRLGRKQVTVTEIVNFDYYRGSNFTYNFNKMLKNGYLIQEKSDHDKRSNHIKLSEKGIKLYEKIDKLFITHTKNIEETILDNIIVNANHLDIFWTNMLKVQDIKDGG